MLMWHQSVYQCFPKHFKYTLFTLFSQRTNSCMLIILCHFVQIESEYLFNHIIIYFLGRWKLLIVCSTSSYTRLWGSQSGTKRGWWRLGAVWSTERKTHSTERRISFTWYIFWKISSVKNWNNYNKYENTWWSLWRTKPHYVPEDLKLAASLSVLISFCLSACFRSFRMFAVCVGRCRKTSDSDHRRWSHHQGFTVHKNFSIIHDTTPDLQKIEHSDRHCFN